jgi:LacI family transcriptional regulator
MRYKRAIHASKWRSKVKKIRRIGLITQAFGDQLPKLKTGIHAYAKKHGGWRLIETSRMDLRHIRSIAEDVEGVIVHVSDKRYARLIASTGVPCVNVSGSLRDDACLPTIRSDDRLVGQQAAEYFLQRGYRHFAFLGSSLGPTPKRRQAAFTGKVHQAGFEVASFSMPRTLDIPKIRREIGRWLSRLPKPLALMASTDTMGANALDACAEFDLSVPQAVAVLSVGNVSTISRYCYPPLSSMSVNIAHRGYAAAQMLDKLVAGQPPENPLLLLPPGRIITRQSSDSLATTDGPLSAALRFIYERACDPIGVSDVVDAVGINRRSLERKFQETLGTSPYHEIRRIRMERAQRLLAETSLTIAEIASISGMGNADNLWDNFILLLKQSPSAYRESVRRPQG